ncbi:MAG: aminoacyl-tRNA hydrolase [Deltaproteobacteria bacterium]|nr:aminoacyl-tRNA hydrolase [Deltaproteobacteria bacterium]
MYLIAGLGNPGPDYRLTRHNMGFRVLEAWAEALGVRLSGRRFQSMSARVVLHGRSLLLLCPMTFMNRSGEAVQACAHYYRLEEENILIVHDDLDLPLGRVRIAGGGGTGGHKGVASVARHLGTREFPRLKIGIGRPEGGQSVESYVLSPFSREERDLVDQVTQLGVRSCESFVLHGLDSAMNEVNGLNLIQTKEERS